MFFPVLLLRDYGFMGWVVFAIPNVVGAAAMGWVLTAQRAKHLWENHHHAVRWFSDITLAYHVFVALWLCGPLFGPAAWAAIALPMLIIPTARRVKLAPWLPLIAVGVALLSWGCFSYAQRLPGAWAFVAEHFGHGPEFPDPFTYPKVAPPQLGMTELLIFLPASITGFLCCPYLDGSFLRARAATDTATGRTAFTLGFGVVFFSMIVFSLVYASWLVPAFDGGNALLSPTWRLVLGIHILVQICFTVTVHVRERGELDPAGRRTLGLASLLVVTFGFILAARQLEADWGELGYRAFLLMYGVTFPAYVWLVMLSRRAPDRAMLGRYLVALTVALPMGVLGFVVPPPVGSAWWLLGALGVVTAAKAVPLGKPRGKPDGPLSAPGG